MARKLTPNEASAGSRLPSMAAALSVGPPSRAYRSPMSDGGGSGAAVMPSQSADADDWDGAADEGGDVATDEGDDLAGDSGQDEGDAGASDDGSEDEG